jgi:predicted phosphodiesterase
LNHQITYILSDLHINLLPVEKRAGLIGFLDTYVANHADRLILNGDIIDLLAKSTIEQTTDCVKLFHDTLVNLTSHGVEVHYIIGNHDLPLLMLFPGFNEQNRNFINVHDELEPFEIERNIFLHYRSWKFSYVSKLAYIEHGHIYDLGWVPGEKWVNAWEKARQINLSDDWMASIMKLWDVFHGFGEDYQARILRTGTHLPSPIYASREAERIGRENKYDLVVLSHFHSPCIEENNGKYIFANPGDSLQHGGYIAIVRDEIRLADWRETINKQEF